MKPGEVEKNSERIASIAFDEASITARKPQLEHEREVAINDITQWNHFAVKGAAGPYDITLGTSENRVTLAVRSHALKKPLTLTIPLQALKTVIRDYFFICESYFESVKLGNLARIEAIDMSRRGLHNEGSDLLTTLLADKVTMDSETSRRLFTLICVLHLK